MTERRAIRRNRRRRARLVAFAAVIIVAAGGGLAWAMSGPSGPSYRTASVQVASVTQTLDSVGTVSAVNKAAVSFPVSGRVAAVPVSVGDAVTAGQVLARLDTTSLRQQLSQAEQNLADDRQTLADDETSQTTAVTGTTAQLGDTTDSSAQTPLVAARPSAAPSSGTPTPGVGHESGSPAVAKVSAAQKALIEAQAKLDTDSAQEGKDIATAAKACAGTDPTPTTFTSTPVSGTITGTIGAGEGATVTLEDATGRPVVASRLTNPQTPAGGSSYSFDGLTDDTSYIVQVIVSGKMIDELGCQQALTLVGGDQAGSTSTGTSTGSGSTRTGGTQTGKAATPEQLAADQAQIDAGGADVAVAQQNLDQASIHSPIAGSVAAVGLTAGASAGTDSITIIGAGAEEVDTTVSLTDLDLVKVGDVSTVHVDGLATPLTGKVATVGVLDSTTGSATTFPVTVRLDPAGAHLFDGAGAAVSITVGQVGDVLTVPSSAVHSLGTLRTVTMLAGGKTSTVRVGVGAVSVDRTQITSGLKAGQHVVLAQLNAPLPASGTTNLRGVGVGGAGLGGAGGLGAAGGLVTGGTRIRSGG